MTLDPDDLPTPLGTVLVTGGCGFLGSHIVSQLVYRYSSNLTRVHVLDLRIPQESNDHATYHAADLTDAAAVRSVLEKSKPDVVIHTASPVFVGNNSSSSGRAKAEELMKRVNIEGTRILVEESKKMGVKAFVYTSSASVVSDTRTDLVNADETYGLVMGSKQREFYSHTKAVAELLVLAANDRSATNANGTPQPFLTTAVRPSAMFGERDVQMIPNMLNVVRRAHTNYQIGRNDNLFDFTYVGNVAHAHSLAAERLLETYAALTGGTKNGTPAVLPPDETKADAEAFIITNNAPVYFWDFARAVWLQYSEVSGPVHPPVASRDQVRTLPFDFAILLATVATWACWLLRLPPPRLTPPSVRYSCMTRFFNVDKARRRLRYQPLWDLDEGIRRSVEWFWEREVQENVKLAK